jgi:hypothetical protein
MYGADFLSQARRRATVAGLALVLVLATGSLSEEFELDEPRPPRRISVLYDISHAFGAGLISGSPQYMRKADMSCAGNQASLHAIDFRPFNVFWMPLIRSKDLPFTLPGDVEHVKAFMEKDGGGVFMYCHVVAEEPYPNLNKFLQGFGFEFGPRAKLPIKLVGSELTTGVSLQASASYVLELATPEGWTILARDAQGKPVVAIRQLGRGRLVACGMNVLGGRRRKRGKLLNQDSVQRMFEWCSQGKEIQAGKHPPARDIWPERTLELGSITVHYSDYLAPYAEKVGEYYLQMRPHMEKWMGVPLLAGARTDNGAHTGKMDAYLLPCGDWAWSGGPRIGIAVFWGGFPEVPTDVIAVMSHELNHSWVHGYGVNFTGHEGLAIYAGAKMLQLMGFRKAWDKYVKTLRSLAANAEFRKKPAKEEPTGKYQVVLYEFEGKYGKDIVARYYRARQKHLTKAGRHANDHDAVWLWSKVTGEDQFPYFRAMGYDVDPSKVSLPAAKAGD